MRRQQRPLLDDGRSGVRERRHRRLPWRQDELGRGHDRCRDDRVDAKVYLMSELPAQVQGPDVLRVCAAALALCSLATLYPAWKAARTVPAEVLRHE